MYDGTIRFKGLYVNPNYYALSIAFLLILRILIYNRLRIDLSFVLLLSSLLFTQSRGATLALIISLFYFYFRKTSMYGKLIIIACIIFLISTIIINFNFTDYIEGDTSLLARLTFLEEIKIQYSELSFLQKIFGVGFGNFTSYIHLVERNILNQWPHNNIILLVIEFGIINSILLIYIYINIFRQLYVFSALSVFLFAYSFTNDFYHITIFWIILGVLWKLRKF
jgi:hypothetical protein